MQLLRDVVLSSCAAGNSKSAAAAAGSKRHAADKESSDDEDVKPSTVIFIPLPAVATSSRAVSPCIALGLLPGAAEHCRAALLAELYGEVSSCTTKDKCGVMLVMVTMVVVVVGCQGGGGVPTCGC